jgi:hypothetical protein
MVPLPCRGTVPVPPPSSHRALAKQPMALHITALLLMTALPPLALCRLAVQAAHRRPPVFGWSAVVPRVAFTYTAASVVGLAAQQAGRPDLIRSPKRVLAHLWEGEMG